jgi:solute carrier family 25 phosphate transporter 3
LKDEGLGVFFTGWLPTLTGYFVGGGVLYATTEFLRRTLTGVAGPNADSLEVVIILTSAGLSSAVGAAAFCPFETVRIRSVAQPNSGSNTFQVVKRMVEEEGIGSLFNTIPVFLVKQVPYACVKFTVFDLSTEYLYRTYPAVQEDLKLSLLISLVGGIMGGVAAAVVSNPADAIISELKKAKSNLSPQEALQVLLNRAGPSALFKGLPLRMIFSSLTASLQFLVFDGIRFALGVGPDDLRLYMDVLGGVLKEKGAIA